MDAACMCRHQLHRTLTPPTTGTVRLAGAAPRDPAATPSFTVGRASSQQPAGGSAFVLHASCANGMPPYAGHAREGASQLADAQQQLPAPYPLPGGALLPPPLPAAVPGGATQPPTQMQHAIFPAATAGPTMPSQQCSVLPHLPLTQWPAEAGPSPLQQPVLAAQPSAISSLADAPSSWASAVRCLEPLHARPQPEGWPSSPPQVHLAQPLPQLQHTSQASVPGPPSDLPLHSDLLIWPATKIATDDLLDWLVSTDAPGDAGLFV